MTRRLHTKKILAATLGLGAVSYVVACTHDLQHEREPDAPGPGREPRGRRGGTCSRRPGT